MALICLIGRHGCGKSSVGRALETLGFKHVSVGLLRRLANSKNCPADVPVTLMSAMRRSAPGAPLIHDTAAKLLKYVATFPSCVLDGFPSSEEHLDLLPEGVIFVLLWTPRQVREGRLTVRAAESKRQWVAGRPSLREQALAEVIRKAREAGRVRFLANRADTTLNELAQQLHSIALSDLRS